MSDRDGPAPEVRERLLAATRRAAERTAGEVGGGPAPDRDTEISPGDLFVFHATAGYDVEWLLTAFHPDGPPRARLAAAVPEEGAGPGDVEVPEDEPGGPLQVRCRHHLWVPAPMLEPGLRSGRVDPRRAAEAERLCSALETGPVAGTPLQRETEEDPDYRDRNRELAAAREALQREAAALPGAATPGEATPGETTQGETAQGETAPLRRGEAGAGRRPGDGAGPATPDEHAEVKPFRRRGPIASLPVLRLAAGLLLVAFGLSTWWGLGLRGELEALREPRFEPAHTVEVTILRGGEEPEAVPFLGPFLTLSLYWDFGDGGEYRLELVDEAGGTVFRRTVVAEVGGSYLLRVPRSRLQPGLYRLRVTDLDGEEAGKVATVLVRVDGEGGAGPGEEPGEG